VHQVVASIVGTHGYLARVNPGPDEEYVQIKVVVDAGRLLTPIENIFTNLRIRGWDVSWLVGGSEVFNATVSITVENTGNNILSSVIVDYYVDAQETTGEGQPYRFLEEVEMEIQMNDIVHDTSTQDISSHLEAMGLSSDQSWTIDYYVYAQIRATGAISGDTLTSTVPETLFDTVTYERNPAPTDPEWVKIPLRRETGHAGFVQHHDEGVTRHHKNTKPAIVYFGETPGEQYTSWLCFVNGDAETPLPDSDIIIHEAYLEFQSASSSPAQRITIHLYSDTAWSYPPNYLHWTNRWNSRLPVNTTWSSPSFEVDGYYNTTDITPLIQALLNEQSISEDSIFTFFVATDGDAQEEEKEVYAWDQVDRYPQLYVRWSQYTASFQPVPRLSFTNMPIVLDLVALGSLGLAIILIYKKKTRKNK
jgi:hypothetical protein